MKLEFTPEDFDPSSGKYPNLVGLPIGEAVAFIANAKLQKWLDAAPVVYGSIGTYGSNWTSYPPGTFIQEDLSHTARLVQIEPYKGKK